jgi:hypothetical protein
MIFFKIFDIYIIRYDDDDADNDDADDDNDDDDDDDLPKWNYNIYI